MIVGIVGNVGAGKTQLAVKAGITDCENGKIVFANFPISFTSKDGNKPKKIDIGKLVTMLNNNKYHFALHEALLLLDEAYAGLDSRVSSSAFSRYISYFLFQSRKLGFDIIFTCQLSSSIDKRLKNLCDLWIVAENQARYIDESHENVEEYFHYELYHEGEYLGEFNIQMDEAKEIWKFYNTQDIVKPSVLAGQDKKKTKILNQLMSAPVDELLNE